VTSGTCHLNNATARIWRVYVMPASVFQSVMIGGGYGTGREIVQFFTRYGLLGGVLGLVLVSICFAVLLSLSYEFARVYRAYDYRRFFRALLGRGWVAFELLYLAMFALVLAVIAAAARTLVEQYLHLPGIAGMAGLLFLIVLLAFYGRKWVTRILAFKAVFLSIVFLVYFIVICHSAGGRIVAELAHSEVRQGWIDGALRYTLYASVVIPAMLFATREIRTRREAVVSGVLSATGGMIPGALLHLSFGAGYPAVLNQAIPAYWMIANLGLPLLTGSYIVVLFGCLLDTGLCFVQSVNERVDGWLAEQARRQITRLARAGIATLCVVVSGGLSSIGVVDLIAKGYGTMAWGFLFLYVGPLLTVGIYLLMRNVPSVQETPEPLGMPHARQRRA
jgi:uncharacterized membrane protein YkvI